MISATPWSFNCSSFPNWCTYTLKYFTRVTTISRLAMRFNNVYAFPITFLENASQSQPTQTSDDIFFLHSVLSIFSRLRCTRKSPTRRDLWLDQIHAYHIPTIRIDLSALKTYFPWTCQFFQPQNRRVASLKRSSTAWQKDIDFSGENYHPLVPSTKIYTSMLAYNV